MAESPPARSPLSIHPLSPEFLPPGYVLADFGGADGYCLAEQAMGGWIPFLHGVIVPLYACDTGTKDRPNWHVRYKCVREFQPDGEPVPGKEWTEIVRCGQRDGAVASVFCVGRGMLPVKHSGFKGTRWSREALKRYLYECKSAAVHKARLEEQD